MIDGQPVGNRSVKPVPDMPPLRSLSSPEVVRVLDQIRFKLQKIDTSGEFAEFCWFAREYPRCYRYHFDCADYRLTTIASLYKELYDELLPQIVGNPSAFSVSVQNQKVMRIYWDFESFLSEINMALDLLARIAGTAYKDQMPPNFNKFCRKNGGNGLHSMMKRAQTRWVNRLKDYRDCFVHYTPVDTLLGISLEQYGDGFEIRGKLPLNPNVREILGFRYSRRVELFRYACTVHRNMTALDHAVAKEIKRSFKSGEYPVRKKGLFFVGQRERA